MAAATPAPETEKTVVLCTGLGIGHLTPMAELAKLLLHRHGVAAATVVFLEDPFRAAKLSSFVSNISSSSSSSNLTFHTIPAAAVAAVAAFSPPAEPESIALSTFAYLAAANSNLRDFLISINPNRVQALVLDFFFTDALDVAGELGIPSYILFTSAVFGLNTFLYLKNLRGEIQSSGVELRIPGLPPIPSSHLPGRFTESLRTFDAYAERFARFVDADGILVNSFAELEPAALMAVSGGLCVDSDRKMNPVHCIGPMIAADPDHNRAPGSGERRHECLEWLDSQPEKSVVFLCFGSSGVHPADQLREIAAGLERSGQRFLWAVRTPPETVAEVSEILPEGFEERIAGRGMVVASWAPQVEVLRHRSTGGFVTHCGWNSTMEAVVAGVPMIGWPMYAEQRLNMVVMAEELRLAVPMKGYDEGIVPAAEVEEKVRWLMESEGGEELRERVAAAAMSAAAAMEEGGGSSYEALAGVVATWK